VLVFPTIALSGYCWPTIINVFAMVRRHPMSSIFSVHHRGASSAPWPATRGRFGHSGSLSHDSTILGLGRASCRSIPGRCRWPISFGSPEAHCRLEHASGQIAIQASTTPLPSLGRPRADADPARRSGLGVGQPGTSQAHHLPIQPHTCCPRALENAAAVVPLVLPRHLEIIFTINPRPSG